MIIKMIKNLESKMEKFQESINKDLEKLKNKHAATNNTITEIKNMLEGINSRISEAEEQVSELEDKMVENYFFSVGNLDLHLKQLEKQEPKKSQN